eukprot:40208_1
MTTFPLALILISTICLSKSGTIIAQSNSSNVTNTDIYDTHTYVIFKFVNISIQNCDLIFNYINNGTIYKIEEIIESNYLNEINLPNYNLFEIKIQLLNGFDFINTTDNQFTKYMLYYQINYETGIREMYAKSVINHPYKYLSYFLTQSNDPIFWNKTTYQLQNYFNNTYLNFTVSNASNIMYNIDDTYIVDDSVNFVFWSLNLLLILCVIIGLAALFHNRRGENSNCMPVDNANWLAIVIYGWKIYDVISDVNLSAEIFAAIFNRECTSNNPTIYCANDNNIATDNQDKFDTWQEYVLLVSGIMSCLFIVIPYALNVTYAAKISNSEIIQRNNSARTWFEQYQSLFISLVVFSGGCYPAMSLVNSNIFGISLLNCG